MGALHFGECLASLPPFLYWGYILGTCLKILLTTRVLIGYLLRIFFNVLPSHYLLLALKIMLKTQYFDFFPRTLNP